MTSTADNLLVSSAQRVSAQDETLKGIINNPVSLRGLRQTQKFCSCEKVNKLLSFRPMKSATGKLLLLFLFISLNFYAVAQSKLPDDFMIGNFMEVFSGDSIKFYFGCTGTLKDKKCADYYRVGKMDSTIINVLGEFNDYDVSGKLLLKANMKNNAFEGPAEHYHRNGNVKEKGGYEKNLRQGRWTFYYPNGNIEKVYHYLNGEPLVLEAYTSSGKATVTNGAGDFKTQFSVDMQCNEFEASGPVLNGKKHGTWRFSNINAREPIAEEIYNEGVFIKGITKKKDYVNEARIRLTKFSPHENINLAENISHGCYPANVFFLKYNGEFLNKGFYKELQEKLSGYEEVLRNQWMVIGIGLDKKNQVKNINVASSINDLELEQFTRKILSKMTNLKSSTFGNVKSGADLFFSVLVDNNQIIIPADYLHKDL